MKNTSIKKTLSKYLPFMVHSFGYENAMKGPNDRIGAQMRVEQQFLRGNSG